MTKREWTKKPDAKRVNDFVQFDRVLIDEPVVRKFLQDVSGTAELKDKDAVSQKLRTLLKLSVSVYLKDHVRDEIEEYEGQYRYFYYPLNGTLFVLCRPEGNSDFSLDDVQVLSFKKLRKLARNMPLYAKLWLQPNRMGES